MILMKSGSHEHLEEMQKQGRLYMKTLKYYSNCDDISRRDALETASHLEYLNPEKYNLLTLTTEEGKEVKIKLNYSSIITHSYDGYVYCMHLIDFKNTTKNIPLQIDLKDEWILIVKDVDSFMDKIKIASSKMRISFIDGKVEYKELRYHKGDKSPFQKDKAYWKEEEYRFYFKINLEKEDFSLFIGNIEDISILLKVRKGVNSFKWMLGTEPL